MTFRSMYADKQDEVEERGDRGEVRGAAEDRLDSHRLKVGLVCGSHSGVADKTAGAVSSSNSNRRSLGTGLRLAGSGAVA